jgi:hypothetical protein
MVSRAAASRGEVAYYEAALPGVPGLTARHEASWDRCAKLEQLSLSLWLTSTSARVLQADVVETADGAGCGAAQLLADAAPNPTWASSCAAYAAGAASAARRVAVTPSGLSCGPVRIAISPKPAATTTRSGASPTRRGTLHGQARYRRRCLCDAHIAAPRETCRAVRSDDGRTVTGTHHVNIACGDDDLPSVQAAGLASARAVSVMPRWDRSRLMRGPTWSSASAITVLVSFMAHSTPASREQQRLLPPSGGRASLET